MSDKKTDITPAQCAGGRGMLGWSRDELAEKSKTARSTLADFEAGKRNPHPRTLAAIQAALEEAGLIFIPENGEGPGVRLRKAPPL